MASLRELQSSFAAALRDPQAACPVAPPANLSIYRNNVSHAFRSALAASFPVVRRRVGDEYFGQLAHHYRKAFPSRSGDLHFVGQEFAGFLDEHLSNGDYAWLADLARIEWAREEALISPVLPAVGAEVLARFAPEQLEELVFAFQPSLRLHSCAYPVFSVWQANQGTTASPADQSLGAECGLILLRADSLRVRTLEPRLFSYLCALTGGETLGEAMERAALDGSALSQALGFIFMEGLVTSVDLGSIPVCPQ
ncbi:MAG: DNA-binding domain-containing protein [Pseudomonadota bacterium]